MTIFSHSAFSPGACYTCKAQQSHSTGHHLSDLVTLSKVHYEYKGFDKKCLVLNCKALLLVYFITYDGNYMTSCLSSFFPVYNELTASRQTVKHFIFQCYMAAKRHQFINSFMIYKKPANVTFSIFIKTDRKITTFSQSGIQIKIHPQSLADQTQVTNCIFTFWN